MRTAVKKAWRKVAETDAGQVVIEDLYNATRMMHNSYTGTKETPEQVAYREGARSVGLMVWTALNHDEEKVAEMLNAMQQDIIRENENERYISSGI